MHDDSKVKKREYDRQYQKTYTRLFSFRLNRLNPAEAKLIDKLEKGNASKIVKAALMQQMYM